MQIEELARKEILKMENAMDSVSLTGSGGKDILELAKIYFQDSKHFMEKGDFIRAFEAVVISWAYVDAGLHMGVFNVPDRLKDLFTIE